MAASVLLVLGGLPTTNGVGHHRGDETAVSFGANAVAGATAAAAASGDGSNNDVVARKMQTSYRNKTDCIKDNERDFVCDKQTFGNGDVLQSCERTYNEKACSNCTLCPLNGGGTGFKLDCSNIANKTVSADQCFAFASSSGVSIMLLGTSTSTLIAMMATTCSVLVFGGLYY
jgi:hypothetical protein